MSNSTCTQERSDSGVWSSLNTDTRDKKGTSLQRAHSFNIDHHLCSPHARCHMCAVTGRQSSQKQDWVIVFKQGPHLLLPSPDTEGGDVRSSGASASAPVKMLIW